MVWELVAWEPIVWELCELVVCRLLEAGALKSLVSASNHCGSIGEGTDW